MYGKISREYPSKHLVTYLDKGLENCTLVPTETRLLGTDDTNDLTQNTFDKYELVVRKRATDDVDYYIGLTCVVVNDKQLIEYVAEYNADYIIHDGSVVEVEYV